MLDARQNYKMCLYLIFPWTQPQMGLPGSGGDAVLKPQNLSAVGCTAGLGEGGILFGDQVCHPLERFSRRIFPRPRAAGE